MLKGPNPEAIKLYRDILRTCRAFVWRNEQGEVWGGEFNTYKLVVVVVVVVVGLMIKIL